MYSHPSQTPSLFYISLGVVRKAKSILSFVEKNKNTFCSDPKCVHPDCHKISLRKSKGKENVMVDNMTVEDIIEIAEEIDIDEFYNLGAKVYLKTFNETQPDFLKINEKQLLAAVKYVESKND